MPICLPLSGSYFKKYIQGLYVLQLFLCRLKGGIQDQLRCLQLSDRDDGSNQKLMCVPATINASRGKILFYLNEL